MSEDSTEKINNFVKMFDEQIFQCMELSKQSYEQILAMPIRKFYGYIEWKSKYEEQKSEELDKLSKN